MSISQSTPTPPAEVPIEPATPAPSGPRISEDWIATITGLTLLILVLTGVITKGMIP
jgi:hypothetical protein